MLGHFRADLGRVTIDRLLAANDQVKFADFANTGRQRIGGSQCISTAKCSITKEDGVIRSHGETFTQCFLALHRAHAEHGDAAAKLIPQGQCHFQSMLVMWIDDARHTLAHQRICFWINFDLGCIRNLLDADYNFQCSFLPWICGFGLNILFHVPHLNIAAETTICCT